MDMKEFLEALRVKAGLNINYTTFKMTVHDLCKALGIQLPEVERRAVVKNPTHVKVVKAKVEKELSR